MIALRRCLNSARVGRNAHGPTHVAWIRSASSNASCAVTLDSSSDFAKVDGESIDRSGGHRQPYIDEVRNRETGRESSLVIDGVDARIRNDWTREEIEKVYNKPLIELVFAAAAVHRVHFHPAEVQRSTLLSIKTGGCSENCGYCSQSQSYKTFVKPTPTMKLEEVLEVAKRAKEAGSTRFCMGSAWREVGNKKAFSRVLQMVKEINSMGMEVCTTLGMLTAEQAIQLKEAGLTAYNHNLDTSREYYPKVVTTRTYDDRLNTVKNVRDAGLNVCCGGIVGLGETQGDRIGLLHTLATLKEHPESVPINALVPVEGTPLGDRLIKEGKAPGWDEIVRVIAAGRIVMPGSCIRLSAGRMKFPVAAQAMMFMAGANSIFTGDMLLTTPNPEFGEDEKMFATLGLIGKPPHQPRLQSPYQSGSIKITRFANASEAANC